MALGIQAALSADDLARDWFDAAAPDEADVDALEARANHERMVARVMARRGMGG